jgi:hypothetical protein
MDIVQTTKIERIDLDSIRQEIVNIKDTIKRNNIPDKDKIAYYNNMCIKPYQSSLTDKEKYLQDLINSR